MNIRNKEFVCGRRLRAKLAKRAGFKSLEFKGTGHPVLKTYRCSCKFFIEAVLRGFKLLLKNNLYMFIKKK